MVIIVPESEKSEPPPYAAIYPPAVPPKSPRSSLGSPTNPSTAGGAATSHRLQPKNYLRIKRIEEDVIGQWIISPAPTHRSFEGSSSPTSGSASSASSSTTGPSVYFETKNGTIDVSVVWSKIDDPTTRLPRAKIHAVNVKGGIAIASTQRPQGLPLHFKAASRKRGDVKICTPDNFRGILALRCPANPAGWRSRIGLAAHIAEQVVCTRETALTMKGKGKQKPADEDDWSPECQTLVEFLVGADLEIADFNRAADNRVGALDLLEAEAVGGRIMILDETDNEAGNPPFDPNDTAQSQSKSSKTWNFGPMQGGVSLSFERRDETTRSANVPAISIIVDEPKWLESVKRKWGKFGHSSNSRKSDSKGSLSSWKHPTANSSSTTLVGPDRARSPGSPPGSYNHHSPSASPAVSPTLSPRLSPSHTRRSFSDVPIDHTELAPLHARQGRSASTSNAQGPPLPYRRPSPGIPGITPPPQHPSRAGNSSDGNRDERYPPFGTTGHANGQNGALEPPNQFHRGHGRSYSAERFDYRPLPLTAANLQNINAQQGIRPPPSPPHRVTLRLIVVEDGLTGDIATIAGLIGSTIVITVVGIGVVIKLHPLTDRMDQ
ncbi:hypothetical protein FRB99_001087 [Tulasnella sp. 403]|nr:hypothetical protein FRB99_001087 [Tulasnella sp. 403]